MASKTARLPMSDRVAKIEDKEKGYDARFDSIEKQLEEILDLLKGGKAVLWLFGKITAGLTAVAVVTGAVVAVIRLWKGI